MKDDVVSSYGANSPREQSFVWTSPLGRIYHTQPPPITHDLPEPVPQPGEPDYPYAATPKTTTHPSCNDYHPHLTPTTG